MKPPSGYQAAPFFVLRTPLLPFDEWLAFADGMQAPRAAEADLESALAADRQLARARLRELVGRAEIREALFVASPSLDEAIEHWLREPDGERGIKAERTLIRYFARMCGRATPFGLFAGCATGSIGETTELVVEQRDRYRRHTRLDMDYIFALCEALARDPELRARLPHRPNSSLYRAAGRLRYAEARLDGKLRTYHLVSIEPSEYLDSVLEQSQSGARPEELATQLARAAEVELDEARAFVTELIDSQVLVSDLQAPVTGPEPLEVLVPRLAGHAAQAVLAQAGEALAKIDAEPLGVDPARYRAIAKSLDALPVPIELARLFQVDLAKPPGRLRLGSAVIGELVRGIELLHRLSRSPDRLGDFKQAFTARYEMAEVPLVEVLDEDAGIGFERPTEASAEASPLLAGLAFPAPAPNEQTIFGAHERLLLEKIQLAARGGTREIRIERADIDALALPEPSPLPDAFAVVATLLAESPAALCAGRFRLHFGSCAGPSGARLFGRFCHGDDALTALVREHLLAEEHLQPNAIFAELVHQPDGRIGNILLRPLLRGWELPFLGASGAPPDRQIPIQDLLVSVQRGRVVLRSRKLGREVIPRLTTAHHYSLHKLHGVYRFLGALQAQGVASGIAWNWGPLAAAPFLPRVVSGRLVLDVARWRIRGDRLRALGRLRGKSLFRAMQELRRELELPRRVALEDADNTLLIDFDHELSIETFVQLIKGRDVATLVELLAGPEELAAAGPEGRFMHEIVVPFTRMSAAADERAAPGAAASASITRRLAPGSDWLFAKIYTGVATIDDLLRGVTAPIVRSAIESGAAASWFFVRYEDPDWHLRLRLQGAPDRLHAEVLPALREAVAPLLEDGRVWRLQLDTYHREIERYGGKSGMPECERLFFADSEAVLAIIELLEGDAGADARWRLALAGVDHLLADLGFNLDAKRAVMARMRASLGREFGAGSAFEKQLGDRFRRERPALEALLLPAIDDSHPLFPGIAILRRRSERQREIGARLAAAERAGELSASLQEIAPSLAHMHVNRMLRSSQRAQELVIYDLLLRLYESRAARQKAAPK